MLHKIENLYKYTLYAFMNWGRTSEPMLEKRWGTWDNIYIVNGIAEL